MHRASCTISFPFSEGSALNDWEALYVVRLICRFPECFWGGVGWGGEREGDWMLGGQAYEYEFGTLRCTYVLRDGIWEIRLDFPRVSY